MFLKCDTGIFKPVFIELGGYWFEIPPETYVMDFGKEWCELGFVKHYSWTWSLGTAFIRNYYTVFDEEHGRIGLAPTADSNLTTIPYSS
mmetsp:Transcript_17076/g.16300  ORF Transcript_17076/g.16300 Transcript_17076/m.16300 type:complete len:89 (+) Transcript_17076:559-825(+)